MSKANRQGKQDSKKDLDDIEDFEKSLVKDDFDINYDYKQDIEKIIGDVQNKINKIVNGVQTQVDAVVNEAGQLIEKVNGVYGITREKFEQLNSTINFDNININNSLNNFIDDLKDIDFIGDAKEYVSDVSDYINSLGHGGLREYSIKTPEDLKRLKEQIDTYDDTEYQDAIESSSWNGFRGWASPYLTRRHQLFTNQTLINEVNKVYDHYDKMTNPERNEKLKLRNAVDSNLEQIKNVLNLNSIPSLDDLQYLFKLPDDFDMNKLGDFIKTNKINFNSFDDFKNLINIPELNIIDNPQSLLKDIEEKIPEIPQLKNFKLPAVSSSNTGLNFDRMKRTITKALSTDFPETTDFKQMMEFQAQVITQAVFTELSKMKFYIEPGQIKVLTNGSPSTHKGNNTNRIKIKLKP